MNSPSKNPTISCSSIKRRKKNNLITAVALLVYAMLLLFFGYWEHRDEEALGLHLRGEAKPALKEFALVDEARGKAIIFDRVSEPRVVSLQ